MSEDTNDWEYTQWEGGYSGAGKSAVWSNNNIEGGIFRRKVFKDGYAKRFGPWNRVILNPKEVEIPVVARKGEGAIFICGYIDGGASRTLQYYNGELEYDSATERFSSKWYTDTAWTLSDSIISRRISEKEEDVGETLVDPNWDASIYGGMEWSRTDEETGEVVVDKSDWREELKNKYILPYTLEGSPFIKRFAYQSLTKSSFFNDGLVKRDANYFSTAFKYLFRTFYYDNTKYRGIELFVKELQHQIPNNFYTSIWYYSTFVFNNDIRNYVAHKYLKNKPFITCDYCFDNTEKNDFIFFKNIYNNCIISEKYADITKFEYDWRICYCLVARFYTGQCNFLLNNQQYKNIKYGINIVDCDQYSKKNKIAYSSFNRLIETNSYFFYKFSIDFQNQYGFLYEVYKGNKNAKINVTFPSHAGTKELVIVQEDNITNTRPNYTVGEQVFYSDYEELTKTLVDVKSVGKDEYDNHKLVVNVTEISKKIPAWDSFSLKNFYVEEYNVEESYSDTYNLRLYYGDYEEASLFLQHDPFMSNLSLGNYTDSIGSQFKSYIPQRIEFYSAIKNKNFGNALRYTTTSKIIENDLTDRSKGKKTKLIYTGHWMGVSVMPANTQYHEYLRGTENLAWFHDDVKNISDFEYVENIKLRITNLSSFFIPDSSFFEELHKKEYDTVNENEITFEVRYEEKISKYERYTHTFYDYNAYSVMTQHPATIVSLSGNVSVKGDFEYK